MKYTLTMKQAWNKQKITQVVIRGRLSANYLIGFIW
jgi:hypothetical protein